MQIKFFLLKSFILTIENDSKTQGHTGIEIKEIITSARGAKHLVDTSNHRYAHYKKPSTVKKH